MGLGRLLRIPSLTVVGCLSYYRSLSGFHFVVDGIMGPVMVLGFELAVFPFDSVGR